MLFRKAFARNRRDGIVFDRTCEIKIPFESHAIRLEAPRAYHSRLRRDRRAAYTRAARKTPSDLSSKRISS